MSEKETDKPQSNAPWHAVSAAEVLASLGVDRNEGLSDETSQRLLALHGPNRLLEAAPPPVWKKLLTQFKDVLIWILILAAMISGALGEWIDAIAILAIVALNGMIGFLQERQAEKALSALKKMSAPKARVIRAGVHLTIGAADLVPGDLIQLESGDHVPADARLLESFGLVVNEASLTGESVPVEKDANAACAAVTALEDRRNMVYMGTVIGSGKGMAIVVATGMQTELGHIAGMLQHQGAETTPLQRRLADLGRVLIVICLTIVALIFGLHLLRGGKPADAFLLAVSLAVAAVPEGLPAVVTIALALGVKRMVKRNALVRRLPSVETLGSVTVICYDKTGTLTRNEMTVQEIIAGGTPYKITGTGYDTKGSFYRLADDVNGDAPSLVLLDGDPIEVSDESDLKLALTIGACCNNARLRLHGETAHVCEVVGDPTEAALLVAATKAGIDTNDPSRAILWEIPFDSARRAMSVIVRNAGGQHVLYTKGAPEAVLERAVAEHKSGEIVPLTPERRAAILEQSSQMASRAMRILALAYRPDPPAHVHQSAETNLIFVGLVGMLDPPRDEARAAVDTCREAGIRPIMITGDHPGTALAVARNLGVLTANSQVLPGTELDSLTDDALTEKIEQFAVYARATAEHKLRIIRAWKARGQVVAMTGDGVNDAPAVKAADIGIAMGITGTDVTKEASDMVLLDDNFASIVSAVEEGRGIFDNVRKVLQFLLSCNLGEILLVLMATLLGWPVPLLPIHLLWINLVTDGLPALALALEAPEAGIMRRKPRPPGESILSASLGLSVLFQGVLIGIVGLAAFGISYLSDGNTATARALAFQVIVFDELLRSLASRSPTRTFFQLGIFTNPRLVIAILLSALIQIGLNILPVTQRIFDLQTLSLNHWLLIGLLALTPTTLIEVAKIVRGRVA